MIYFRRHKSETYSTKKKRESKNNTTKYPGSTGQINNSSKILKKKNHNFVSFIHILLLLSSVHTHSFFFFLFHYSLNNIAFLRSRYVPCHFLFNFVFSIHILIDPSFKLEPFFWVYVCCYVQLSTKTRVCIFFSLSIYLFIYFFVLVC